MIIVIVLFAILIGINVFQLYFSKPGSDHYIHFGYINSIKANNNKFITKVITYLNEDDFPDPQLYHWLLAFIPSDKLARFHKYFGMVFNVLSLTFFISFLYILYPYLSLSISSDRFLLISGLIYIVTPFEYFVWNAKNVGLSARGFGVMFGHLFVFAITLYVFSEDISYLFLALFLSYIILLSSQFAFQFIFFFTIIFSIVSGFALIATIPFVSTILFLLTFPKWSKVFFTRQWQYKKMYYLIFSKKFGLKARYSIWRDFIYDFWIAIKNKGFFRGLEYIYRNPVIEVLIGFPALTISILIYAMHGNLPNEKNFLIVLIILVALSIFLLTSFRPTRFLGEPQRYIEFVFPIIALLPSVLELEWTFNFIMAGSLLIILFELVGIKAVGKKQGGGITSHDKTIELLALFNSLQKDKSENNVFSNNYDILKHFAEKDYRILNVNVTAAHTGGYHFNEIFPENYGNVSLPAIPKLLQHYGIHWFILDQKLLSEDLLQAEVSMHYQKIEAIHHYTIYKRC